MGFQNTGYIYCGAPPAGHGGLLYNSLFGYKISRADIMCVKGNRIKDLKFKCDCQGRMLGVLGLIFVVVSASVSDAVPFFIEGNARDNEQSVLVVIRVLHDSRAVGDGLQNSHDSGRKLTKVFDIVEVHDFPVYLRDGDLLAISPALLDKFPGHDLVLVVHIAEYGGSIPVMRSISDLCKNSTALLRHLFIRGFSPSGKNNLSEFFLIHRLSSSGIHLFQVIQEVEFVLRVRQKESSDIFSADNFMYHMKILAARDNHVAAAHRSHPCG